MTRPIDNTLSRSISHVHPEDEAEMGRVVLMAHLIRYHGWNLGMFFKGRTDGEEGTRYMERWHRNAHKT